jgi:hypothetical protein
MSDSEHDDEFEAYLKRQVPIHKGMTSPERPEPPPELDRIIIGNARKAIQSRSPVRLYRAPKWALPVGLAATILISFATLLGLGVRTVKQQRASIQQATLADASRREPPAPQGVVAPSPAIPTAPWPAPPMEPPATASSGAAAPQVSAEDKARTRIARADVAARRSRNDGESADRRDHPDPATWLARIEKLRAGGLTGQAEQELKRFHEAYPGYALPSAAAPADGRAQ